MKKIKYIILFGLFLFILAIIAVFIFARSSCSKNIMGRYQFAENSLYEVAWERMDCSATTSYREDIYILKKGESISWFSNPILRADKSEGLRVSWLTPNQVEITFSNARIHSFKNYWYNQHANGLETISILLKQATE